MRLPAVFFGTCALVCGQWVMSSVTNPAVRAIAPDVHAVYSDEQFVYVESAGLSLHSFGALEANQYDPPRGPRTLNFRLPRNPRKAQNPLNTPLGVVGVFVTGVPIYNPIGTNSYQNQNIWHQDAVATALASGQARLPEPGFRTSVVGFALDGFPIQAVAGIRSSYRLRSLKKRNVLPDGTVLTPSQEGPDVGPDFPLGYFAEDYEYVPGSGDLDECNGMAINGGYSYFMTPTWPYLLGSHYYGEAQLEAPSKLEVQREGRVELWTDRAAVKTGEPVHLTLVFRDRAGHAVRFPEKVHEQPVHLIVVSKDMAEFDHIHPEPVPGDALSVAHTFTRSGDYWLYADYTLPGEPPAFTRFAITVTGNAGKSAPPGCDPAVSVKFNAPAHIQAGQDIPLSFTLSDRGNSQPIADLEPWLGAWAHIMIVGEDGENFIHAHPLEGAAAMDPLAPHSHTVPVSGPSPATIRTVTGFRSPGRYRLWLQFQRGGVISTISWPLEVGEGSQSDSKKTTAPADAIPVTVSRAGFTPARLELPVNRPARLAFTRTDAQNCGSEVVFPSLGLRKSLPVGETVIVDLPALAAGQLNFACGMGMYKGAIVIK